MQETQLILGLLVVVAAIAWLSVHIQVPYPVLLVLAGLGIGLIPELPRVELNPGLVFVIFLPPLLYYEGMQTTWRDFKKNLRPISLLAIGLVLFTTCLIAVVARYFIEGINWPAAFLLGAIISPTDAVAASAVTKRMRVPRWITTILEGESLVNDATALVAYKVAIIAVVAMGGFVWWKASINFVYGTLGGVVVGYFAGKLVAWVRPRLNDPSVEMMVSLLTPFIAYLPAEWLGVSGVLAAVTAGLYLGRRIPTIVSSSTRLRLYSIWEMVVFLLNGLIFILIGLQLPLVTERLSDYPLTLLISYAVLVTVAAVVIRLLWVIPSTYLPRLLIPRFARHDPPPPWQPVFLIAWTGMRGIVSLAAAMALPMQTASGAPFPGRDLIIFITFGVILCTLVVQGLTLPYVIRWLGLKGDDLEQKEEAVARLEGAHAALARLEALGFLHEELADLIARVRVPYQERVQFLIDRKEAGIDLDDNLAEAPCHTTEDIQHEAITAERRWLVKLRDDGVIGDDVLRKIQQELDFEEAQLTSAAERPIAR